MHIQSCCAIYTALPDVRIAEGQRFNYVGVLCCFAVG